MHTFVHDTSMDIPGMSGRSSDQFRLCYGYLIGIHVCRYMQTLLTYTYMVMERQLCRLLKTCDVASDDFYGRTRRI